VDRLLGEQRVGFGYGGLAAGADIVFAEALLAFGAELHVVLPVNRDSFVDVSVAPFGDGWTARFEQCLSQATSIRYASQDPYRGDEHVFAYSSQFAMGCAVLRAQTLATEAIQLAVWDGHETTGPSGVAADLRYWARSGRKGSVIDVQRPPPELWRKPSSGDVTRRAMKAMLFADVKGFGTLRDDQIPAFVEGVMGRMARTLDGLEAGRCMWRPGATACSLCSTSPSTPPWPLWRCWRRIARWTWAPWACRVVWTCGSAAITGPSTCGPTR
jgi:hypothetical protein